MPEFDEQHDLSDDSDYAASQQQGLGGSVHSQSAEACVFHEHDAFEIVYSKENVSIHTTQNVAERISGQLHLVKQHSSLFLCWVPYIDIPFKGDSIGELSNSTFTEDRQLYAIKYLPFSDVHSVHRHTPPLGWQYLIIVLSSGLAYPPLYFYSGGVREFLAILKQHVVIARSADNLNIFLVNDLRDPLQRSLSSLELPRAIAVSKSISAQNTATTYSIEGSNCVENSSASEYHGSPTQKYHDPARDISLQVLEKFSRITRFAREATSQIFQENQNKDFITYEKRHEDNSSALGDKRNSDKIFMSSKSLEFDDSELAMGELRQDPLDGEEWATFFNSEGRINDSKALRKRIFYGGIKCNLRKEIWKFLLGYHLYDSTYSEREYLSSVKKSEYEGLKSQWQSISTAQAKRFSKFRERRGLIEKDAVRTDRSVSYYDGDDNPHVKLLHDILLTYSFYNFDLGYCQGMSDLLSPLLFVIEDESESFWCFVMLMERFGPNFNRDQSGMHSQLFALSKLVELLDRPLHDYLAQADCINYYYCFRWILIQFKREFEYQKVLSLWEVLWTHHISEHFHLYICVAILKKYRMKIMTESMDFDTILKFVNDLSGKIDLDDILRAAESLCRSAGEKGAASIPPGTPPSFPIDSEQDFYPENGDI
ncbi:TBC1 domain family member 15-like [Phalaenopsis equestris]|uniref:TBC1 domain family member 15-like n=1 Tax=Phalaenopsis equestris TaxID=78828 RepID=UPI0009E53711|nr:TBC1 domain family member 15-like [Phalaenopsis equestris]